VTVEKKYYLEKDTQKKQYSIKIANTGYPTKKYLLSNNNTNGVIIRKGVHIHLGWPI